MPEQTALKTLPKGDYFKRLRKDGTQQAAVYVKGEYDHSNKKFCCYKFDDVNSSISLKGDTQVTQGFEF